MSDKEAQKPSCIKVWVDGKKKTGHLESGILVLKDGTRRLLWKLRPVQKTEPANKQ